MAGGSKPAQSNSKPGNPTRFTHSITDALFAAALFFLLAEIVYAPTNSFVFPTMKVLPFVVGVATVAVAAAFGTLRFLGGPFFVPVHNYFSNAGATVGLPLIGILFTSHFCVIAAFHFVNSHFKFVPEFSMQHFMVLVVVLLLVRDLVYLYLPTEFVNLLFGVLANGGMGAVGYYLFLSQNLITAAPLLASVALFTIAGVSKKSLGMDFYHFNLTIAFALAWFAFMSYNNLTSKFFEVVKPEILKLLKFL